MLFKGESFETKSEINILPNITSMLTSKLAGNWVWTIIPLTENEYIDFNETVTFL